MIDDVKNRLSAHIQDFAEPERTILSDAMNVAEREHHGQSRKAHKDTPQQQDPYVIHPFRAALILLEELEITDPVAIASAILHDVVEDGVSQPTVAGIEARFGPQIAEAVRLLSKPAGPKESHDAEALAHYYAGIHAAPLHVRLVKLCDRLDNLREILLVDRPAFQKRYLAETREVYMPLAGKTSSYFARMFDELCADLENLVAATASSS